MKRFSWKYFNLLTNLGLHKRMEFHLGSVWADSSKGTMCIIVLEQNLEVKNI